MTAALISAAAAVVVALIEAIAARDRRRDKKEREKAAEQQKMQEQLMLKLIEGSWAAIALGEATAKLWLILVAERSARHRLVIVVRLDIVCLNGYANVQRNVSY